jgi:bacteriocin-like protein
MGQVAISNSVMTVTSLRAVIAYGRRTLERERVMTANIDRELSRSNELRDEELASVSGGLFGLMGEILSNVSKTRSEISMTFARNAHA